MQRNNTVVGLLRVTMIGVALSATPIFNSAYAQQSRNGTNLLLEVQNLRQEIAQLRDMVERQQFQMRKLQRQIANQTPAQDGPQGFNRPVSNYPAGNIPAAEAKPNWQGDVGTNPEYQPVPQGQRPVTNGGLDQPVSRNETGAVIDQAANGNYGSQQNQPYGNSGSVDTAQEGVEERVINAPPLVPTGNNSFPPVVDRSIGRTEQTVPITGEGVSGNSSESRILNPSIPSSNGSSPNLDDSRVFSQDLPSSDPQAGPGAQNYPSDGGGIVTIPPTQDSNGGRPIAANQIPIDPATQTIGPGAIVGAANAPQGSSNQGSIPAEGSSSAEGSRANNSAGGLSEVEFYNQGFELLKQSKYEDASAIFEQQIAAYPRGDRADDAHYWISEAMHVSRKLDVAKVHLKTIIKDFPQSNRLPDAMLKTAYIEQSQGNQIEARILFQEIVNYHPKSDAAIAAKNQLASSE